MEEGRETATETLRVMPWEDASAPGEAEARQLLESEGYRPFLWSDSPGTRYPEHLHDCDECILVLEGEIRFDAGGERHILKRGDRLYLPRGTRHTAGVPASGVTYLVGQRG